MDTSFRAGECVDASKKSLGGKKIPKPYSKYVVKAQFSLMLSGTD